ncbi:sugar ABC transporter substrate-binding protein [Actinomyces sp. oral taxon 414]|uniref:ABC transporter substrate-binding protein n=1 Tax=Actinomyces sp. oral taxon 414 TaxID=712122 RepID=UPI0006BD1E57|nr:ABC transporter substrate-binding protein [Actinomyces sp. oral taxon 414]ALC99531.1 sugar ABC transporter substrate-binding protein [Actinomyces sp. oral taxon 414]
MTTLRQRVVALLTAATTALAITACSGGSTPTANGSIDVLSWWTSTSESSALNVLVDRYEKQNPGASVDEIAVVGGGGSQAHVVLATRIAHGDPPDVWQSLVGGNITAWHNAGAVGDVSSLFTDEVKAQLPENVLSSVSVDGKQYAAPLSAHRANVLMYNRDVLKGAGIAEPGEGYTLDQFLADLEALKAKGTTALCIGGADSISTAGLFEAVLLATVGKEGWEKIEADRFDWSGQEVQNALSTFGRLMDYTDATGLTSTWSEASGRLAAGECGFYQMNDSAFAESTVLNDSGATASAAPSAATNVDPSTAPSADPSVAPSAATSAAPSAVAPDSGSSPVAATVFPGTEGTFLMVVDSFVVSSSTGNRDNANAFLTTALDPQVETDFCKVKGCVPVRNDADVSSLTPYQQQTADALRSQTVLNSISYGEVISPAMQDGFFQAVKNYIATRDAASFNRILTERLNEGAGGPNH